MIEELKRYKTQDNHSPEGLLVSLVPSFKNPNRELIMGNHIAGRSRSAYIDLNWGFKGCRILVCPLSSHVLSKYQIKQINEVT